MDTQIKTAVIKSLLSGEPKLGFSINQFVDATSIGRSKTYEDIKSKKLKAKKNGKRTVITIFDAIDYLENLPEMEA
ncbi:MAG: hypothetical protein QNL62_19620 [Gammaproteobacteria bacterium]|nr:hypothetical protein [Gammaproteobacteria bacterium]